MRKIIAVFFIFFIIFNLHVRASDSHTLNVNVNPVNEISLNNSGNTVIFNINSAGAVTDDSTILNYTTNESNKKITVSNANIDQGVTIKITPADVSFAIPNTVTLSNNNTTGDIITGLGNDTGSCNIEYTVDASEDVQPANYSYDLIYTIVDE